MATKKKTKQKPEPDPQVRVVETFTKRLRVPLTEKELLDKSTAHVGVLNERDRIRAELDEIKSEFRDRMKRVIERCAQLRRDLEVGSEDRSVRCEKLHDYKRGKVLVRRMDTAAVIEEHDLEDEDRQLALDNGWIAAETKETASPAAAHV